MFSKPRRVDTEDELYDIAIRALMRRAHSVNEMKQKLARRAGSELLLQVVMARLKETGKIDDGRYAEQFARQRTQDRKQGKFRVARDLRARGVSDLHIAAALAEASEQSDESAIVRQRIQRKLNLLRGPAGKKALDQKKMASLYASLLRAGFPSDVIRRELKALTREEVPDAESEDDSA